MEVRIPFNHSALLGRELEYISSAMRIGQIAGDQTFTRKCHALLEETLGVPKVLLTSSCTHALEMSALLLRLQRGDEVIVPSFAFVTTVNAFVLHGATPVFCDVRADTLNLDETLLDSLVTERTRAIVPLHYAGVGCEMNVIGEIAERRGIRIIEDNAHGLFGRYEGQLLGTFGALATQSFHETKNLTCGEGGALIVNDPDLVERAEVIREKGTNRSRFFRGEVDKYTWIDVGSSYLMSDVLAAFLYGQLELWAEIQVRRQRLWETYDDALRDWATARGIRRPVVPDTCEQAYHMYYVLMPSLAARQALIRHLRESGISAVFHYQPLHLSEMGRTFGGREGQCPVTEDVANRLLRLPFYNSMDPDTQGQVVEALLAWRPS